MNETEQTQIDRLILLISKQQDMIINLSESMQILHKLIKCNHKEITLVEKLLKQNPHLKEQLEEQ